MRHPTTPIMPIKHVEPYATEVARMAGVPEPNQLSFHRLLRVAINDAHKDSLQPAGLRPSAGALAKDFFDPVMKAAKDLRKALERLQGYHLASREEARSGAAAHFLAGALAGRINPVDVADPIPDLVEILNLGLVIEVTERAKERAKNWLSKAGRKKGTGRASFDIFVTFLLTAVEETGGTLTIFRTSHGNERYGGSLLKAVNHLRPLLPQTNFYPVATLGGSLNSVYQRWRLESGKSPQKKK